MEIIKEHLIHIYWEGSYKDADFISLKNEETDYGIYQIYGNHVAHEENVLLYIG